MNIKSLNVICDKFYKLALDPNYRERLYNIREIMKDIAEYVEDNGFEINEDDINEAVSIIGLDDIDRLTTSKHQDNGDLKPSYILIEAFFGKPESEKLVGPKIGKLYQQLKQEAIEANNALTNNNVATNAGKPGNFNAWAFWANLNDILQFAKTNKLDTTLTNSLETEINKLKTNINALSRNQNLANTAVKIVKNLCRSYKGNNLKLNDLWKKLYQSAPFVGQSYSW